MGVLNSKDFPGDAMTPTCNDCGIGLCWDISNEEYQDAKPFWDEWICEGCNNGHRLSLKAWKARNPQPNSIDTLEKYHENTSH